MGPVDFASALWCQRDSIRSAQERLLRCYEAVNRPGDLPFGKWLGLYALALEFAPDLILELGRGYGNSTCVFTEVANQLRAQGGMTSVVSIGYDAEEAWRALTVPRLAGVVSPRWFAPVRVLQRDILQTRLSDIVASWNRVFVFWDAHGRDLATYVLAELMPALQANAHVVAVDDIADARYFSIDPAYAGAEGHPAIWYGHLVSAFEEVMVVGDFCARNGIAIHTPNESLDADLLHNHGKCEELEKLWGSDVAIQTLRGAGGWIYFDLSERKTPERALAFPRQEAVKQPLHERTTQASRGPVIPQRAGGLRSLLHDLVRSRLRSDRL